ncbi:hypothetical protein HDV03_002534 [Kappamyces sp. JEL0829]|nr:hypothetical protein HDV03_002534 [Kappamyces sp. JEL0829]
MSAKGKKGKPAADEDDSADLQIQDKLSKCMLENDALQRELEVKNEINARLRQQVYEHKQKIHHLETQAELRAQDRLDLTSDMARQFKTMQAELISEVNRLENITFELQTKLTGLQTVYADEKKRHAETVSDKDATIEELNMKMSYMVGADRLNG